MTEPRAVPSEGAGPSTVADEAGTELRVLYVLNASRADSTRTDSTARERLACRRLIRTFAHVFHGGDLAHLTVVCVDRNDVPTVEAWVRWAGRLNGYGDPPAIEVQFGGDIDEHALAGAVSVDASTLYSEESFFRAYEGLQARAAFAYEDDKVTDIYELDLLAELRRHRPQFDGSVFLNAERRPRYREYLAWLAARGGRARVLDVGCGAGALYGLLERWSRETGNAMPAYLGIDYSRTHILRAKKAYPDAHFQWGSLTALQAYPGQFDLCVATSVLNFVPPEGQLVGLERMLSAAGGRLFTVVNAARAERYAPIPPAVEYAFLGVRRMPACHAGYGEVKAILDRYPQSVVEEGRVLCGYSTTHTPGLLKRVEIPLADEEALLAQGLPDAEVARALRQKHDLKDDEGPFEAVSLAIWPADAVGLPPAPDLPDDLYEERRS